MRLKLISYFLLFLAINVALLWYIKADTFPFAKIQYISDLKEFNSLQYKNVIPTSSFFKSRIQQDLAPIKHQKSPKVVLKEMTIYTRSHLKDSHDNFKSLDDVLKSEGPDDSFCSGTARFGAAVAQSLGYDVRVIWVYGHTFAEVYFPDMGWVFWDPHMNLIFEDQRGTPKDFAYINSHYNSVRNVQLNPDGPVWEHDKLRDFYDKNKHVVILSGARLFDFERLMRSPTQILKRILTGTTDISGTQLIDEYAVKVARSTMVTRLVLIINIIFVVMMGRRFL